MKNDKKGFTLTEILVVIVIIGIVLAISIPSIVAIRKRINERLLQSKIDTILVAAELYGRDKGFATDTLIYVYTLINADYLNNDIEQNATNCTGLHTENGCVIDPTNDTSLNEHKILIKRTGNSIVAVWDGTEGSSSEKELVDDVKERLECDVITESNPCLYPKDSVNNYLYYSGVMWRILGVYKIDGTEVVKMVTDDNVVWEVTT